MFGLIRSWQRRRAAREPFPEAWRAVVDDRLPFAASLDEAERARFLTHLQVFAKEKNWEGAGGLTVTDEMKVVIAGAAARLARNLSLDVYDGVKSIVIYPGHYKHPDKDGIVFGEVNSWGTVVLSWDAVEHGIGNPFDGHHTALHEFAHALDFTDGEFDGTPTLPEAKDYQTWTRVFSEHYLKMKKRPHKSVLRRYGATNEAEFFAVASETFFEKPDQLKKKSPELYEELRRYYKIDPAR
jgi:hypothetical protein